MPASSRVAPYQHLDAEGSPCWTRDCSRGNRAVTVAAAPRPDFGLRGLDAGFRASPQPSFDDVMAGSVTPTQSEPTFPFTAQMRNESIDANLSTLEEANENSVKPVAQYYAKDIAKQVLPSLPTAVLHAITSPVTGVPDLVRTLGLKVGIGSKDAYFERKKAQAQQETTGRLLRVMRAQYASTSLARKQQEELEELSIRVSKAVQEDGEFNSIPRAEVEAYLSSRQFEGYLVRASSRVIAGVSDDHRKRIAIAVGQMAPWRSKTRLIKKEFLFDKALEYDDYHIGVLRTMDSTMWESLADLSPNYFRKLQESGYNGVSFAVALRHNAFDDRGNWEDFRQTYRQLVADDMVTRQVLDDKQQQPWVPWSDMVPDKFDTKPWKRDLLENGIVMDMFISGEQMGALFANPRGMVRNLTPGSLLK